MSAASPVSVQPYPWCTLFVTFFAFNTHNTMWGQYDSLRIIVMRCTKTISITFLRFYDFVRLWIVISFQIIFSNSTNEWHPFNQICVGVWSDPGKSIAMQPLKKKFLQLQNKLASLTIKTWVKTHFLSQILRKLWGTEYFAHLAQMDHFIFCL